MDDAIGELEPGAALWQRAASGQHQARERLFAHAGGVVRDELQRRGVRGADVDDLAQQTLLGVLQSLERAQAVRDLDQFLKFRAWGCLSDHRRKRRTIEREHGMDSELDANQAQPRDAECAPLRRELVAALGACIGGLARPYGDVFRLRYEQAFESDEISRQLGLKRDTVNVRLFRAREQVRECMQRKGFAAGDLP